eukprot:Skav213845  [mRNA]  locus=scaffold2366:45859:46646:- [translate_table: standard]
MDRNYVKEAGTAWAAVLVAHISDPFLIALWASLLQQGNHQVLAAVNAHSRPLTCLRLAQPHAAAPAASMDVFYTAGLDGTVKLWDLRSMQERVDEWSRDPWLDPPAAG